VRESDLSTQQGRHRAALENHERALAMYDLIFPPWRWRKWWHEYRAVNKQHREIIRAIERAR